MEKNYEKDDMVEFFEGMLKENYLDELKEYNPKQVNRFIDELRVHYDGNQDQYKKLYEYQRKLSNTNNLKFSELEKILQDVALVEFELTENPEYSMTKDELEAIKKDI
ncbi:MAG: hypothetical protein ACOCRX_02660 [Candidatus Woesearchaeota archaeon]